METHLYLEYFLEMEQEKSERDWGASKINHISHVAISYDAILEIFSTMFFWFSFW